MRDYRVLLAGAGILLLAAALIALRFFPKEQPTSNAQRSDTPEERSATTAGSTNTRTNPSERITGVANAQLVGTELLYVDSASGEAVRKDLRTNQETRSPLVEELGYLTFWSPAGAALLTNPPERGNWLSVDVTRQVTTPLHTNIFAPTWSPKGDRIAYVFTDEGLTNPRLTVAQPDGTDWETVLPLNGLESPYERMWWGPQEPFLIALNNVGSTPTYVRILLSSKRTEVLTEGAGGLAWSPSGQYALLQGGVPTREDDNTSLVVADVTTGETSALSFAAKVGQCAWQNDATILCVTPDARTAARLARDGSSTKTFPLDATLSEQSAVLGITNDQLVILTAGTVTLHPIPANE